jgi:hypothetical protein
VELDSPLKDSSSWNWISLHSKSRPCVSVISATVSFDVLFRHLAQFTEVALPDGEVMFFAFWDPAILGTLIGQPDDLTLHVKGPVLTSDQQGVLMRGITKWWYWDRNGVLHLTAGEKVNGAQPTLPLMLTQSQVDELVEASVPDHILYYVELNQPLLIVDLAPSQRYEFVRRAFLRGRDIGLTSMGDLVNFVCMELIYKERMREDELIVALLENVKKGDSTFLDVIGKLP